MAGLFGIYDPGADAEALEKLVARMQSSLCHEQWYVAHRVLEPPFAGGRVSLGLTNPDPRPGCNEDGTVLVWFDGEIYDFWRRSCLNQLRQAGHQLRTETDSEIVAHLYEDLGEDCMRDLDGNFSLAILDRHRRRVILAIDRDGYRPIYFFTRDDRLLFASEVKALLQDASLPKQVDEQGVVEFFTYRAPQGERTLLRHIRFLPNGCRATFQDGAISVKPYWLARVIEDQTGRSRDSLLDEYAERLKIAVRRQLQGDFNFGAYLSGGLDSRLVVGVVPDAIKPRFHTFTFGPPTAWDVRYGAMIGKLAGGQHHTLSLLPEFLPANAALGVWLTDGLMTVIDIYKLVGIKKVRALAEVVFFGYGRTDGIIGGIELSPAMLRARSVEEVARLYYNHQGTFISDSLQARVLTPALRQATQGAVFKETLKMFREAHARGQSSTLAGLVEAVSHNSRWARSSMYGTVLTRYQMETRYPYSDNELEQAAWQIPVRWRLARRFQIDLIRRTRPDMARVPWEYSGVCLDWSHPAVVFFQRGRYWAQRRLSLLSGGLIPFGSERERADWPNWFRTVLRPWLEEVLLSKRTLERGYYQPAFLRQMVADHIQGRQNYAVELGLLCTFELWNRLFIDGDPVQRPD